MAKVFRVVQDGLMQGQELAKRELGFISGLLVPNADSEKNKHESAAELDVELENAQQVTLQVVASPSASPVIDGDWDTPPTDYGYSDGQHTEGDSSFRLSSRGSDAWPEFGMEASSSSKPTERDIQDAFARAIKEGKTQRFHSPKVCFVGHARAGKTSTLLALRGGEFDWAQPSTDGVQTCSILRHSLQAEDGAAWCTVKDAAKSIEGLLRSGMADAAKKELSASRSQRAVQPSREGHARCGGDLDVDVVKKMPIDLLVQDAENPDETIVMQAWDFAGQEMYYSMVHVFLTSRAIYVLVLDLSKWATEVSGPLSEEIVESVDFWLAAIFIHAPEAHLIIVGTHDDELPPDHRAMVHKRVSNHLEQHLEQMPKLHERLCVNEEDGLLFYPIDNSRRSAQSQDALDRLRARINGLAQDVVKQWGTIPSRWAHFFNMLTAESGRCASLATCDELAKKLMFEDVPGKPSEVEACLKLFHDMGHLLFFGRRKDVDVVLDCQWLLDAMAHVVACPRVLQKHSLQTRALHEQGKLTPELLEVLWAERFSGYEKVLQAYLEHFDLLVPSGSDSVDGHSHWLVPSMLPHRCRSDGFAARTGTTFLIDFHGALRQLLPTLLPRLICHLHTQSGHGIRVKGDVYRDFGQFLYGAGKLVTLSTVPWKTQQLLQVSVQAFESVDASTAFKEVLDAISDSLLAWLPSLPFKVTVPCPVCQSASGTWGSHLLCLKEVLEERILICERSNKPVHHLLPESLSAWRQRVREGKQAASSLDGDGEMPEPSGDAGRVRVDYLYASPLYRRMAESIQPLQELAVKREKESLHEIAQLDLRVASATEDSLAAALLRTEGKRVLHLSAHGLQAGKEAGIILERESSAEAYIMCDSELAALGNWGQEGLVVVLFSCGSDRVVQRLMQRHPGLRCAICCREEVFDGAARVFCKRLYLALSHGHTVAAAHQYAQEALKRGSMQQGYSAEAEKFVLITQRPGDGDISVRVPAAAAAAATSSLARWPSWPAVEDYVWDYATVHHVLHTLAPLGDRRAVLLHGPSGVGKTSVCRELSRHVSAPGRVFGARVYMIEESALDGMKSPHDFSYLKAVADALHREIEFRSDGRSLVVTQHACTTEAYWRSLAQLLEREHEGKPALIIVDLKPTAEEAQVLKKLLEWLLKASASLCLVLTAASTMSPVGDWGQLLDGKVVSILMHKLPARAAAQLFARRTRRPLYLYDFTSDGAPPDAKHRVPLDKEGVLRQLQASQLIHDLDCLPGRVVKAAASVDENLDSLRRHPHLINREILF
mmetsp:Transcript_32811/g.75052  ORF Transcript_32811/g.75052 Transcript_32811/m.75052 type:complete len:1283 (+) Transcript_32811:60-3908(+)